MVYRVTCRSGYEFFSIDVSEGESRPSSWFRLAAPWREMVLTQWFTCFNVFGNVLSLFNVFEHVFVTFQRSEAVLQRMTFYNNKKYFQNPASFELAPSFAMAQREETTMKADSRPLKRPSKEASVV
jgi:hypothetical protein